MTTSIFSLTGVTPPARFDDLAWITARIEQADTETGTYTSLETFTLDPVDTDPSQPISRSFTTELATTGKWYRVVFVDADADESEPSAAVENTAEVVSAYGSVTELARNLNISGANLTLNTDALTRVLLVAAGEIRSEIGRSDLAGWEIALATEVNLERAAEHWQQMKSAFGIIGLGGEIPMHTSRDSWDRHARKLAPLKRSWGLA